MNILITGCNGQLGNEMRAGMSLHNDHHYLLTDINVDDPSLRLDITDKRAVETFVREHQVDLIVNCAAYTNVDKAEEDELTARRINCDAVANLAEAAEQVGAKMIHISTDYVFDGKACVPYTERDAVCPATAYGRTKRAGEEALLGILPDAVIIRTAWLYSPYGNNFVKTMIRLGQERDVLRVVFDQVGSPTYARDLATAIYAVIEADEWHAGIYHFTNEGVCSWYDFTREIHSLYNSQEVLRAYEKGDVQAARQQVIQAQVLPITSDEYPAKTPRPHYSVLNKNKIKETFGLEIPYWRDSLAQCIRLL